MKRQKKQGENRKTIHEKIKKSKKKPEKIEKIEKKNI